METLELTQEQIANLAIAAANVAGGRHEFRADGIVRAESSALVATLRKRKNNSARREAYKWRMAGQRFAFDIGYSETDSAKIAAWQELLKSRPNADRVLTRIARYLCIPRSAKVENWRETVSEYIRTGEMRRVQEWRDSVARLGMTIPLSLADMRADHGSRFYNYAVRKWNTAGYAEFLFGSDVADAFQTAMAECLAAGDWTGAERRPAYGALWRHMSLAVRRAVWSNTRFTYDAPEAPFSWEEWEQTANAEYPAFVLRATGNRQSLAEWAEYAEYRAIRDAMAASVERIKFEREERLNMLSTARKAIAQLVLSGMTVTRIANMLGRNVESLASDLASEELPLAPRMLPSRDFTETERADIVAERDALNAHAELLRMRYADMQADNYANGRVFRRGEGSTVSAMDAAPSVAVAGTKGSVLCQGNGWNRA